MASKEKTILSFAKKDLTKIPPINTKSEIKILNLSHNQLANFEGFKPIKGLKTLSVDFNPRLVSFKGIQILDELTEFSCKMTPLGENPNISIMALILFGNSLAKVNGAPVTAAMKNQADLIRLYAVDYLEEGWIITNTYPLKMMNSITRERRTIYYDKNKKPVEIDLPTIDEIMSRKSGSIRKTKKYKPIPPEEYKPEEEEEDEKTQEYREKFNQFHDDYLKGLNSRSTVLPPTPKTVKPQQENFKATLRMSKGKAVAKTKLSPTPKVKNNEKSSKNAESNQSTSEMKKAESSSRASMESSDNEEIVVDAKMPDSHYNESTKSEAKDKTNEEPKHEQIEKEENEKENSSAEANVIHEAEIKEESEHEVKDDKQKEDKEEGEHENENENEDNEHEIKEENESEVEKEEIENEVKNSETSSDILNDLHEETINEPILANEEEKENSATEEIKDENKETQNDENVEMKEEKENEVHEEKENEEKQSEKEDNGNEIKEEIKEDEIKEEIKEENEKEEKDSSEILNDLHEEPLKDDTFEENAENKQEEITNAKENIDDDDDDALNDLLETMSLGSSNDGDIGTIENTENAELDSDVNDILNEIGSE
ncbi:putative internalin [Histomonas meleagridis]|uniref:putative internalin n=1 Tax=Histomonas meleagridis TaxID=135588 RepID=UPI00355A9DA1|nr:putative internalin [Histomonas meleagridis]KAH0798985.1 putative internalin [Histomonas meleagridis]